MPARSRRLRCPECGGLNTKRHDFRVRKRKGALGEKAVLIQRRWCNDCRRPFTPGGPKGSAGKRYTTDVVEESVRKCIEDLAPYRTVARRSLYTDLAASTIFRWVNEYGQNSKDAIEIATELEPKWRGVLSIDGKAIKVFGVQHTYLIALDIATQDLVHARLVVSEDYHTLKGFIQELKHNIHYPLSGVVIDYRPGIKRAIKEVYPGIPIQVCVIHLSRQLDMRLPKRKGKRGSLQNRLLKELLRRILFAKNLDEALAEYKRLLKVQASYTTKKQCSVTKMIKRHFPLIVTHHLYPHIPRDNNVIENVIKQLSKKLKLANGYNSSDTADNCLRLIAVCYRFKRFTDSKNRCNNGKCPLQLAGVNTTQMDWLTFSQRNP